jgi:hypothetical protein
VTEATNAATSCAILVHPGARVRAGARHGRTTENKEVTFALSAIRTEQLSICRRARLQT